VVVPSAVTEVGLATNVVVEPFGTSAVNVTAAVLLIVPIVAVTVFVSAVVDESVVLNTPALSVLPEV
jgi:hypothetical protein